MPLGEWRLFYFGVVLSDNIWCNIEFQSDAVEYVILFDTIKIILFPFYGLTGKCSLWRFVFILIG